eukprot:9447901-Pyramimonas_sp.AAC.1
MPMIYHYHFSSSVAPLVSSWLDIVIMPASSKEALDRKRTANRNRARVREAKNFLNKPWVRESLKEAAAQFKRKAHRTLCDALADAAKSSNKCLDRLYEKNRVLRGLFSTTTTICWGRRGRARRMRRRTPSPSTVW